MNEIKPNGYEVKDGFLYLYLDESTVKSAQTDHVDGSPGKYYSVRLNIEKLRKVVK